MNEANSGGGMQVSQFFVSLDALGYDRHAERVAKRLDRPENALTARALVYV